MEEKLLHYCFLCLGLYIHAIYVFICSFVTKSLFAFSHHGNVSNTKQFSAAVEELLQ